MTRRITLNPCLGSNSFELVCQPGLSRTQPGDSTSKPFRQRRRVRPHLGRALNHCRGQPLDCPVVADERTQVHPHQNPGRVYRLFNHLFFVRLQPGQLNHQTLPCRLRVDNCVTGPERTLVQQFVEIDCSQQRITGSMPFENPGQRHATSSQAKRRCQPLPSRFDTPACANIISNIGPVV